MLKIESLYLSVDGRDRPELTASSEGRLCMTTHFKTVDVNGTEIFYREAGDRSRPTVLLLHGFPSSSHMFRELIPELAGHYHVIAPDLPGFGQSVMKPRGDFSYTFDNLADVIDRFTEVVGLTRFAIYVFDYGAPIGLRIAARHPERIPARWAIAK